MMPLFGGERSVAVEVYVAWYCVALFTGPLTLVVPAVNGPPPTGFALLVNVHCVAPAGRVHVTCVLEPAGTVLGFVVSGDRGC